MRNLDLPGMFSLFAGVIVVLGSILALVGLSPSASHHPLYQVDILIRHVTYFGPALALAWLAFIPSRAKVTLLKPALAWTALFILPFAIVLGPELFSGPRIRTGPDLEQVAPAEEKP